MTTESQFPTTMEARLAELTEARTLLLAELNEGNFDPQFREEGRWSIGEVVHHLCLVEGRVTGLLKMLLNGEKREKASDDVLLKEWTLISSRATNPEVRSQAPEGTLPEQPASFEEAVAVLQKSRENLLAVLKDVTVDDLASVCAPHPMEVIGMLTGAGWLTLVGYHERRHTRQIRNVKTKAATN